MKLGILFLSLAGALAFGQNEPAPMPLPMPIDVKPAYESVTKFLALTDAQRTSLLQVQEARLKADRAIYEQMGAKRTELNRLLQAGSNDAVAIGRLMVDINNLQRQLPTSGAPYRTQALAVLNDAQKAKLAQLSQALEMQQPAGEAVALNLIDYPNAGQPPRILPLLMEGAEVSSSVNVVK